MLREPPRSLHAAVSRPGGRALLAGLGFNSLTEAQVVEHILAASRAGRGGWVATPNIDICRQTQHDEALRHLVASGSLIVPDSSTVRVAPSIRYQRTAARLLNCVAWTAYRIPPTL